MSNYNAARAMAAQQGAPQPTPQGRAMAQQIATRYADAFGALGAFGATPMITTGNTNIRPNTSGTCPAGYVKRASGMGGKGQPPPMVCVPAAPATLNIQATPFQPVTPPTMPVPNLPEATPQGVQPGWWKDKTFQMGAAVAGVALLIVYLQARRDPRR